MAKSLTNSGTEMVSNLVLDQFVQELTVVQAFTLDCNPSPVYRGDCVKVLSVGTASAALAFDKTAGYSFQDSEAEGLDVQLNQHPFVSCTLSDADFAGSSILTLDAFARSKKYALGNSVVSEFLNNFTSSTFCPTSMSFESSSFGVTSVTQISNQMDQMGVPNFSRTLILNPHYHSILLQDKAVQNAICFGSPEVIQKGIISNLDTFSKVTKCNVFPGTEDNVFGYAVCPQAAILAMRPVITQDNKAYNQYRNFTDEATGMTITFRSWLSRSKASMNAVWDIAWGWVSGNPLGIIKLYHSGN